MRTTQSLLTERRLLVQESRDPDPAVRAMAQFQIEQIDIELNERQAYAQALTTARPKLVALADINWSPAQMARAS